MHVLREISSHNTAMWVKVGIGLALMGLSVPTRRLRLLGPVAFVAGIEIIAWALLRPPFVIAASVVVVLSVVVVAILEKRPANAAPVFSKKPKIVVGEVAAFRRGAQGSRQPNDLQVVYAKVRNARDGGGETATLASAEAWMQAFDERGNRVGSCQGNWMTLRAGVPDQQPIKSVTLRPTGEEFALEIGGKFLWGEDAWLAGETHPSLKRGTYRIRASVSDGVRKAEVFEWKVTNPGADKGLLVDGAAPREPSSFLAGFTGASTATSYGVTQTTLSQQQESDLEYKATEQQQASERGDELHPRAHQDPGKPPHSAITQVLAVAIANANTARPLIEQGQALLDELWKTRLRMKQSGAPIDVLPTSFVDKVRAWDGSAKALTDKAFQAREASNIERFPTLLGGLVPPAQLAKLIESNLAALRAIERQGRRK